MGKKLVVYGGVVAIWVGGAMIYYKIVELMTFGYVGTAAKVTEKLRKCI